MSSDAWPCLTSKYNEQVRLRYAVNAM